MTTPHRLSAALEGIRKGAYDFLLLPFEGEQLSFFVQQALKGRRIRLANRSSQERFGELPVSTVKKSERILVQDDEEPIREIVSTMLSSMGYECHLAETAEETLGILAATQIDVALCGIFEWTVVNFRPMIAKFPDVSVCVLTASQHIDMVLNPLGNGAYDFLLKPLNAINYCFWCIERWSVVT